MGSRSTVTRWQAAVIDHPTLSPSARLVALVIGERYMDYRTLGSVRPGAPRLARDTGTSKNTVYRALAELVAGGLLVEVKRGHRGSASMYVGKFPPRFGAAPAEPLPEPASAAEGGLGEVCGSCQVSEATARNGLGQPRCAECLAVAR